MTSPSATLSKSPSRTRPSILVGAVVAAGLAQNLSTGFADRVCTHQCRLCRAAERVGRDQRSIAGQQALLTARAGLPRAEQPGCTRRCCPWAGTITRAGWRFLRRSRPPAVSRSPTGASRVSNIIGNATSKASNGVGALAECVLLPADNGHRGHHRRPLPRFQHPVEAVAAAGLVPTLQGRGPFTVFAPPTPRFAALLAELGVTKEALLADTACSPRCSHHHVVSGPCAEGRQCPWAALITTVQGQTFTVNASPAITDQRGRSSNIVATDVFRATA